MKQAKKVIFTNEEKIIHHLILQATSIDDNGLFYGKIGISIAFLECSKFWNNLVYFDYANELNNSFLDNINDQKNYDFEKGLSGLGWGIEYITQHFSLGNKYDKICIDIDKKIMTIDMRRNNDISLNTGLEGTLHYMLIRLKGFEKEKKGHKPFDDLYLKDTYDLLQSLSTTEMSKKMNALKQTFIFFIKTGVLLYTPDICSFINHQKIVNDEDILSAKLGIADGLAGKLMEIIFHLDNHNDKLT